MTAISTHARTGAQTGLLRPVARPAPLRQPVCDSLRELVITGHFQPGQHLVEAEVARLLGVSRHPVREALQKLAEGGWVDLWPNKGAFVHVPTDQQICELLDACELLEASTAELAARRASAARTSRLRAACRDARAAAAAGDEGRFLACDGEFHRALADAAGNTVLAELSGIVSLRSRWYLREAALARAGELCGEHQAMAEAIAAGDPVRAATAARSHIEATRVAVATHGRCPAEPTRPPAGAAAPPRRPHQNQSLRPGEAFGFQPGVTQRACRTARPAGHLTSSAVTAPDC